MKKLDKNSILTIAVICLAFGFVGLITIMSRQHGTVEPNDINGDKRIVLYQNMRRLWADHVIWTREYINGVMDNVPGTDEAVKRLLKNQEDIGAAIVPYYGIEAGNKLTVLLKDHIQIAIELVAAAKANDVEGFKNTNTRWNANAVDITTFFTTANSTWSKAALDEAITMHQKLTIDEIMSRLNKQYAVNIVSFDAIFGHIQTLSDMLSAGIIKQFAERF